jgi:GTP-binding protein
MKKPIVAIVGRPNVGKSTLFNRLISRRLAIVDDRPGVTRDRLYADTEWQHRRFILIDTGGLVPETKDSMERVIKQQVQIAVEEADAIIFMVDCQIGLVAEDQSVARALKKAGKPMVLVVNKADNDKWEMSVAEFYRLGLGDPFPVSAMEGRNTGDLLDAVVKLLPPTPQTEETDDLAIKLAIVGKPNVGKSSLVNALLGKERMIVDSVSGTTRDAIDTHFRYQNREYIITDTAGIRRRSKINDSIEYYSVIRAMGTIARCDVALVLIDAREGLTTQDLRIMEQVEEAEKGCILLVNKWDLLAKDHKTYDAYQKALRQKLGRWYYIPVEFISVLERLRVIEPLDLAAQIKDAREKTIKTTQLNDFLECLAREKTLYTKQGKQIKFYYATQAGTSPPTFIIFTNSGGEITTVQHRFVEKHFRERFEFPGTPIRLWFRGRK